ncbi:MAG: RraA family protein [Planctomycetota bacterium]|nr:RraA family protein [Planctomycetota bacterium]
MLISLEQMRQELYCAVVCDALDQVGLHHQSPRISIPRQSGSGLLVGRCKTTLWADMFHNDPNPYELELKAVDDCQPDDVLIAAAGGSMRSGIWGELLTTAAKNRGCIGAIVDGAVRDVDKIQTAAFPLFFADSDGVVVVPRKVELEVLRLALAKVHGENKVRDAIRGGMTAVGAFEKFGIL